MEKISFKCRTELRIKKKNLLVFGCAGSSLLHAHFSCGGWGLLFIGPRASPGGGFSCCRAWLLGAWAPAVAARRLVVVAHGLSCSAACGIFQTWD